MSRTIGVGLVGAGMIGDVHVANVRADGRAEIVSIADADRATLERKLATHGVARGSTDYRDLVADPGSTP